MSLNPSQARLAFALFLGVSAAVATNVLGFQERPAGIATARIKGDRLRQKAESDRSRRLALAAGEAVEAEAPSRLRGGLATATAPTARVGLFAPSATQMDVAVVADADSIEAEQRVRQIQRELASRGYEPGTPDGVVGLVTRAAILAFEHDRGLPLTAEPSADLLAELQSKTAATAAPRTARSRRAPQPQAEILIRTVQQSLLTLGHYRGTVDGRLDAATERAIRDFETQAGLPASGRISAPLVHRMARATSMARAPGR